MAIETVNYGTDVSTSPDLDMSGETVSGVRAIAECTLRRFTTDADTLDYDPDFGRNLQDLLNEDFGDGDIEREQAGAETEAEKDERILSASVSMVLDERAFKLTIRITGTLNDGRATPFLFVLSIDKVSAEILKVA